MFDWIVCLGAERPVADMRVHCPGRYDPTTPDAEVDVEVCLSCRYLIATAAERIPQFMCAVGWAAEAD